MEDSLKRYEELVGRMIASGDRDKMRILREADTFGFAQLAAVQPKAAQRWLDKLEAAEWNNFLSQAEAEEIAGKLVNQNGSRGPKWPFTVFSQTVEAFSGKMCDEPYYNKYAMWVAANMIYSDHAATLAAIVPDGEMPKIVYRLAVDKLKDPDRPDFIRNYFGV